MSLAPAPDGSRRPLSTRLRLGTMGYAYADWKGVFFPRGLKSADWLGWYARRFDAVELNTTFHAMPTIQRVRRWADAVGDDFRFSIKVPREITHDARPIAHRVDRMRQFLDIVQEFSDKLGIVLIQLPPWCGGNDRPDVEELLQCLPTKLRFAVEFRNARWQNRTTEQLLREYGVTQVAIDHEDHPEQAAIRLTSDIAYIRLIGRHGRYETESHEVRDPTDELRQWHAKIAALGSTPRETWVLFNNDFAGHAPDTLRRFAKIAGVPHCEPPAVQRTLFD